MNKNIIIFLLSIALFAFSQTNLEAVSTQKILARVQKNIEKIKTRKISMGMALQLSSGEEIKATVSLFYKSPDKIKMQGEPPMPTIIISGKKMSIKLSTGQTITKTLSAEDMQNIARPEMGYNFRAFISSSSVSLAEKESEKKKGLYVLEIIPVNSENENLQKVKWYIDYRKSFIYKTEVYDSKGKLTMILNYTELKLINHSWLPLKSEMTMYSANGDIITYATYDYIQLNKEIPDKEFQ